MNGEQQQKALNYALFFLRNEINSIKETLKTASQPFIINQLERRLKELESDFEMFLELENCFI